jgi:hypothetical protein
VRKEASARIQLTRFESNWDPAQNSASPGNGPMLPLGRFATKSAAASIGADALGHLAFVLNNAPESPA